MKAIKACGMEVLSSMRVLLCRMLDWRDAGLRAAKCAFASLISIAFIACPAVFAAEPYGAPRAADPVTTTPAGGLVQVTLSLLLVLAAVFAAAWAVRRLRGFGRLAPGAIEIVADVALGQKERVVLVQIGKQQLLLGVASGSVNTLHVLEEPIAVSGAHSREPDLQAPSTTRSGAPVPPHLQFKAILKRSLGL